MCRRVKYREAPRPSVGLYKALPKALSEPYTNQSNTTTPCYAIVLPGRRSGFQAGSQADYNNKNIKIGPPAGLWPAGGPMSKISRLESGRNPAVT